MRQFAFYSGIIMISIYIIMGITLIFSNAFINELGEKKTYIGIGLIVYGAFRMWITFRMFKNKKPNQE